MNQSSAVAGLRKAVVATAGLVGQLVALNVLHGQALQVATGVLAGATLLGVYVAPNTPGVPAHGVAVAQLDELAAPLMPADEQRARRAPARTRA